MNNYTALYWLTRLDYIRGFLLAIVLPLVLITIFYTIFYFAEHEYADDDNIVIKSYNKFIKIALTIILTFLLTRVFIPSKNDVIMIYAGGKTMDFVQQDSSINKIPSQTTKLITDYLESKLKTVDK